MSSHFVLFSSYLKIKKVSGRARKKGAADIPTNASLDGINAERRASQYADEHNWSGLNILELRPMGRS